MPPRRQNSLPGSEAGTSIISVLAQCAPVPLATYYRWFGKLEGVDGEYRFLGRTQDPLKQITDQPAAGTLQIKVEAANEAGPGSDPIGIDLAWPLPHHPKTGTPPRRRRPLGKNAGF